tara:strand:+ start:70 stop:876 length:807 start_codon:yes stop_codon:yes gene_type:complete
MTKKIFPTLDKSSITKNLNQNFLDYFPEIIIKDQTGSTNDDAKLYLSGQVSEYSVHLAEQQIRGKGRNGKKWISPKGKNIYLSLGWKSPLQYSKLDGLSLSIGTCIAKVLNIHTNDKVGIKWPNDLILNQKKICGILIETLEINESIGVVIGVGINVHMSRDEGEKIDQSWISLDEYSETIHDRNEIISELLNEIFLLTQNFPMKGFESYKTEFENFDLLKSKDCILFADGKEKIVKVIGVNNFGELLVMENSKYLTLRYGEVSLREL